MKIQKTIKTQDIFREISTFSLESLRGRVVIPRDDSILYSYIPLFNGVSINTLYGDRFYRFRKVPLSHLIIGIDASIIPIAESDEGYIFGLRGATVKYFPRIERYSIYLEGPFIFYFTRDILDHLEGFVSRKVLKSLPLIVNYIYAKKIILSVYEWLLIKNIVESSSNSIILIDGVVEPRFINNSFYISILELANRNNNFLLGISKRSRYLKYFSDITSSLKILGLEGMIEIQVPGKYYSKVYIGLFRRGGYPFRIDVNIDTPIEIINEVYSTKLNIVGYPEVLKESHVLSKLSHRDAMLLRALLAKEGVRLEYSEPYREAILGAYEHIGDSNEAI